MLKFSKEIYNKQALLKASYSFTDRAYIHIDVDEQYYLVDISPKTADINISSDDFKNEILAQTVRLHVSNKTKNIRELLLARALSSTLLENKNVEVEEIIEEEFDINNILEDWFKKNE